MYKPNRSRKKECSILISRSAGHDIVFVKTLMEMFIQPMIDSALKNPEKNPLECFTVKIQDKTIGEENVTLKQESKEDRFKCDQCDKICAGKRCYKSHVGRMHTVKLDSHIKRKRSDSEESQNNNVTCDTCNSHFANNYYLNVHKSSCKERQNRFHDSRQLTPANKKAMRKEERPAQQGIAMPETANNCSPDEHNKQVPKHITPDEIPMVKVHQPQSVIEIDDKDQCDQCIFKSEDSYKLKQHKRDFHRDCSASVTTPPKKRMGPEPEEEEAVEIIMKKMDNMKVGNEIDQIEIKEENRIPRRLAELLRVKGINIETNGVLRVGGGGKCGARCVSIHTTG